MATHGTAWPPADRLVEHRRWRPDGTTGRTCLDELDGALADLGPVSAGVTVRSVVLGSVVRRRPGYEWTVRAEVPSGSGDAAAVRGRG